MTEPGSRPLFSVIVATRDRASLFAIALRSVLEQRFTEIEVLVVNDGSSEAQEPLYREVLEPVADRVKLLTLVRVARGHGPGFVRNFAAAQATGDYLCFLDDDDQWTDPAHLGRAAAVIATGAGQIDLVLCNQRGFRDGAPVDRTIWIEDLPDHLRDAPDAAGGYTVTAAELLLCRAHCHLNTTIVSRDFYLRLGGLDEGLRYEEDRDFYLRAIDQARSIKFLPDIVSRHNIPDPRAGTSMSTAESELSKRLYQLRVMDKAILFSTRPELRRYAMRHRLYALEHIAAEARRAERPDCAAYYRREALLAKLAWGWTETMGRFVRRAIG